MGIAGIFLDPSQNDAATIGYKTLFASQHRGQAFAGLVSFDKGTAHDFFAKGLASNVFSSEILKEMSGNVALAQVSHDFAGLRERSVVNFFQQGNIAVGFDGKITNINEKRQALIESGCAFSGNSDNETIIRMIAKRAGMGLEKAIATTVNELTGSFSMLILTDNAIFATRDEKGVFPLCIGKLPHGWLVANESGTLESVGADFLRDIQPGEMVIIDRDGIFSFDFRPKLQKIVCAFEYIYFARADSCIDGISVQESRLRLGAMLAKHSPVNADAVLGIPDSATGSALGYSSAARIPFKQGFIHNAFALRSNGASETGPVACQKLNVLKNDVAGKKLVVVDDSVISGATVEDLSRQLKRAGAKEVHFRIASSPVQRRCPFNSPAYPMRPNMKFNNDIEKLRNKIGAESIEFLSCDEILEALRGVCPNADGFCCECMKKSGGEE